MALINEKGILSFKGEVTKGISKAGNEWARQTIVVDCLGYKDAPFKIALTASLRELSSIEELTIGDPVEFAFMVSAREWEGKWYNNVDLYSIRKAGETAPKAEAKPTPAPAPEAEEPKDDLPF